MPRIAQTPLLLWTFRIGFRDNGGNTGTRNLSHHTTEYRVGRLKTLIARAETRKGQTILGYSLT